MAVAALAVVDADEDRLGLGRAGGVQDVEAGAVAVVELEAEAAGLADAVGRGVDDRDVDAAGEQRLGGDLAEAAEADHERPAVQAVGRVDAIHRGGDAGQEAVGGDEHERRERHGEDGDRAEERAVAGSKMPSARAAA
jgi:hypothetical protein